MNPLEFMAAVLPSAGVLCVAGFSADRKQHVFADRVEELAAPIDKFNKEKLDTYFALASFNEKGTRVASNALFLRSLFLDLDCGEGKAYATKQDAATALDTFLQDTPLGPLGNPWIVSSGGGLHVYWPLTSDVPVAEWRVAAENLKRLAKRHAFNIDMTVTADASRVLRVPGTRNWKISGKPRACKILVVGAKFEFSDLAEAVKTPLNGAAFTAESFPAIPGKRPTKKTDSASKVKLLQDRVTYFKNIAVRTEQGSGCAQLRYYRDNATQDGMEPLWRALLSLTKVCEDGEEHSAELSALHPYPIERMRLKLNEIKGPYPCTKFDTENPGICTDCAHWGKITNPLALGAEVQVDNSEKQIVIPAPEVETAPMTYMRPTPPRGFSYGKSGGVYRELETEDEDKNKIKKQFMVLPYDLFVVDLLNVEGEHHVYMMAMRPDGTVKVTLPQKAVVTKDETIKALAAQNIIAAYGTGNDKNLADYVRGCVEDASTNKEALKVPSNYGWQPKRTFVTGGCVYYPDNSVRQMPMPGLDNLTSSTVPLGTLEDWRRLPQMLIARSGTKAYAEILAIGFGVGFGSPLFHFSGLDGFTFHAGSTGSGTGKTLALGLAASIWGHPKRFCVNKGTSAVTLQQRAGLLGNLPLLIDEITSKSRKDPEWLPEFIFDLAEGVGKERMESGTNKERTNNTHWSLMSILSANNHATDYMTGRRKHSSSGELMRMLEWTTSEAVSGWSDAEVESIKNLRLHYGTAGAKYAQWLTCNYELARSVYMQTFTWAKGKLQQNDNERYWIAAVAACVTGIILAGKKYADIIDLPVKALTAVFVQLVDTARGNILGSVRSAEDILNAYTAEFYGRFINVRALDGAMLATFGESGIVDESITRTQISGRVERGIVPGYVSYFVEETLMKTYCNAMSFGYADFKKQLEKLYRVEYVKKDMLAKTKGPQMRVNVLKISRPESDMSEIAVAQSQDIPAVA